jgi:hypothetical protein
MTTRTWTREELDRVHPLPEGCSWRFTYGGELAVVFTDADGEFVEVMFEGGQVLASVAHGQPYGEDIHEGIALPLILASQGLDSREAMAKRLDELADVALARVAPLAAAGRDERAYQADGDATGLRTGAAMVRRGRVAP